MDSLPRLIEEKNNQLVELYTQHEDAIMSIRGTLAEEFEEDERAHDTRYIFRLLRKHKFDSTRALSALRDNLLTPQPPSPTHTTAIMSLIHTSTACLLALVSLSTLPPNLPALQSAILTSLHTLLIALSKRPVNRGLQFVLVLDVRGASISATTLAELVPWYMREVHPRYPGMCAGVLVSGYSWTHSGVWAVLKRILPSSAATRVVFPTSDELETFLEAVRPPAPKRKPSFAPLAPLNMSDTYIQRTGGAPSTPVSPLAARSVHNPAFGYPVRLDGRRRKRDLARTLAVLLYARWRKKVAALSGFGMIWMVLVLMRRWRTQ